MVINLSERYSLLCDWICELRDVNVQTDRMRFRRNLERIGEVAAIEISRTLAWEETETQTPLGVAACKTLKQQPVLATILRAGLPLHQGLLNYFIRGLNSGALTEEEALATGLTLDELHSRSFVKILKGRRG